MSRAENDAIIERNIRDAMQARRIPHRRIDVAIDAARKSLDESANAGRDLNYSVRCSVDAAILALAWPTE